EFQDDYVYDISSRLKEVNAAHFAEPLPSAKENRVRFADDPVDRVICYSPTPLLDVEQRLQLKKEYLIKLLSKGDSERGDNASDESDLFSSSDDEDFVDRNNKTPSPIVEMPRSPSPSRGRDSQEVREAYSSDDETEEGDSTDGGEYDTSATNGKFQTTTTTTTSTSATLDNSNLNPQLDRKIEELVKQSMKSFGHQAGGDVAKNLASQIASLTRRSLKNQPVKATAESEELLSTGRVNGEAVRSDEEDQALSSVTEGGNVLATDASRTQRDVNIPTRGSDTAIINDKETKNEEEADQQTKLGDGASPSPEPPAVTLNDSKRDMVKQSSVDRQPPRNLPIKSSEAAAKSPTSSPVKTPADKAKSPPGSPSRRSVGSPRRGPPQTSRGANTVDRLAAPASSRAAFPPSPTRFIRKTGSTPPIANGKECRVRPASSTASSSDAATETRKLPAYTGNERSRYGLPAEEKMKLTEERERLKREKEKKARREEEEKRQRKLDAQKTFEAWLKNKNVEENTKKSAASAMASSRKKTLSPQPQIDETETTPSPSSAVTFLTWLQNKKIQERQRKLQQKLQRIEIEELERKHTRQDAQQAYKRWLRKKALESEQLRMSQRQRVVEERLNSSSSKSKEVLNQFFESEHFASLGHHDGDDRRRTPPTPALESIAATVNGTA
ncbi:hypothetical protein BIW11_13524, partial [Tropilaelaps mercedesae]